MPIDYTLVCGVDKKHLRQLAWVWPTWKKSKPSLLQHPMIVFYDASECGGITCNDIKEVIDHPDLRCVAWNKECRVYPRLVEGKFGENQRYKMLAGFVHVPAKYVDTKYWLKLDVDTVATGQDDWIDENWFKDEPAIIAQPWGFTKPANQMLILDEWSQGFLDLCKYPNLNLIPEKDSERVGHKRIISWCGFFNTEFTERCSEHAQAAEGDGMLPVASQDGYMWYMATRTQWQVVRAQMKKRGWEHWSTEFNILKAVEKVMSRV